jgi:uncharacterized membrane protein (TIGR02234 family)
VAGNQAWADWSAERRGASSVIALAGDDRAGVPLAGAVALVALASWGVLLVTRGWVRRSVAALATLASIGMVATSVLGYARLAVDLRRDLEDVGLDGTDVRPTVWYWVFLACALLAVAAAGAAFRWAPGWPEMGQRYDAPGRQHPEHGPDATGLDLWKAMDEGRDPTLPERRPTDP